jgi:hypothetical protein
MAYGEDMAQVARTTAPLGGATPGTDAWAHRISTMQCRTCMWFAPKLPEDPGFDVRIGRCRRHAPTMAGYPAVFPHDWCGDHKLDENKL